MEAFKFTEPETNSTREAEVRAQPVAAKISGLSMEKRALLEARLLQRTMRASVGPVFNPAMPHPLSATQESIWFLDRLEPGSPLYNIPEALRLKGPLNLAALCQSLEMIVERQSALRTEFISCEGKPMQVVREKKPDVLTMIDLTGVSADQREAEAREQIEAEAKKPFDLSRDILLRGQLLKLGEQDHILLLTMHHIISDLWSFVVLHRELEALYAACDTKCPSPLEKLPLHFAEISGREAERCQSPGFQKQAAYWKDRLGGGWPELQLPADQPRPATPTFRGERRYVTFPASWLEQVKGLGRKEGVTLYTTLLAGFVALLQRYTNQDSVAVGSPVGGRHSTSSEKLIGYFVNTLPIRLDFDGDPNGSEWLRRTRDTVLGAFSHQEVPMEKIIEELRWPRMAGRNPLFQTVFQLLPVPPPLLQLKGTSCELMEVDTGTAKFDLTATLFEEANELHGHFEFNSDLFDGAFIERMIGHYQTLLTGLTENPNQKISALGLLTEAEQQKMVCDWNTPITQTPGETTIHQIFAQQAAKTPNAVAVICQDKQLTYAELNHRADRIAEQLRRRGVKAGSLVGFCVERSLEMMAGVLGILKAGGAYVTFDPAYPRERLEFMFEDTKATVFVTTRKFASLAAPTVQVVCLDEAAPNDAIAEDNREANLVPPVTAEHPAYVIYTSGSTGKPKGVVVPHRGVTRLVKETNYLRFTTDDVFLQFAPISFDASTFEIFGPLLNGGKLVMFPPVFESLEQLGGIIQRNRVTTLWLTSGLFSQMVEHHIESLKGVRWLLAGGDVLSVPHVLKALRELPDTQLINGYGPTENTTFTTCYALPKNWEGKRSVPIGKPISQTQVYILDKAMQPVPIGISGELFIGGEGLALEYLNAPELTAKKFVSNPFSDKPGAKLYRTGDLVRWRPDGNVEFLGRLDFQVKIRGFRVELGEIENALAQCPAVKEAVVVAHEDKSATKQLVAYAVLPSNGAASAMDLREFLEQRLPAPMVPSQFIFLDALPLNANGKVDRHRLPEPADASPGAPRETTPPRNETETALVRIWGEVLARTGIGIHDNLFEIGGHSLIATRLVSRISRQFNVDLPLRTVFEAPTIAAQAGVISQLRSKPATETAPILRRRRSPAMEQPAVVPMSSS